MKKLTISIYSMLLTTLMLATSKLNALNITVNKSYNNKYNIIYATGRIHGGDLYKLKRAVRRVPKNKQTIVVFSSMGGELNEGIKLGKYIYANRIATAVKRNSLCASSCAIAFLGGRDLYGRKMMILPSSSKLGYHNFYYKSSSHVSVSKVQNDLSNIVDYFSYVRAPNKLMSKMLNTKSSSMYWITQHSNRYLSLRKGLLINSTYANSREKNKLYGYNKYSNQKEALKKYFYNINKAITSNRGYVSNNVALNNSTTYKFWLEAYLNYVYVKSIKKINSNTLEANVVYSLKNGTSVYSKNIYKLARNSNGWHVVSKKIIPARSYRKSIKSIKNKLP